MRRRWVLQSLLRIRSSGWRSSILLLSRLSNLMRYSIFHLFALIRSIRDTSHLLRTLLKHPWMMIQRCWCNSLLRSIWIVMLVLLGRSACRCRMMTIIQLSLFQLLLFLNIG